MKKQIIATLTAAFIFAGLAACGSSDGGSEGKAELVWESEDSVRLQQSLDSMVFETHTFGDYTVRLVGEKVRTDEANFPGSIYTQNLRVEVEKNGDYLDMYDLDCPVIAMKYYYDDDPERTVMS